MSGTSRREKKTMENSMVILLFWKKNKINESLKHCGKTPFFLPIFGDRTDGGLTEGKKCQKLD